MPRGKRKHLKYVKSDAFDHVLEIEAEDWAGLVLFAQVKFGWKPEVKGIVYYNSSDIRFSESEARSFCDALTSLRDEMLEVPSSIYIIASTGQILRPNLGQAHLLSELGIYGGFRVTSKI